MRALLIIILSVLVITPSIAGTIDDNLTARTQATKDNDKIKCRIVLSEQFDIESFKKKMTMANSTRAERHAYVINSLREIAGRTQPDLLAYLESGQIRGTVDDYSSYWIANIIIAELAKTAIESIAARSDVDVIALWREPELIEPIEVEQSAPMSSNVEIGLDAIGAPEMWELGYTGVDRLVANLDTGVDGYHPALISRWRGNNGAPWQECWFDGYNPDNEYPSDTYGHGTHTMGTLAGLAEITGDTIGVAHGALWIAANTRNNMLGSWQWLVDPDGDPSTIDDVPDVVSNSWGTSAADTCWDNYWIEIDNCEAAGIAVVFSAGNSGPDPESVANPANRIESPYNAFSVGMIDGNDENYPIAEWSSRGPSPCDHETIKPEVVAPGILVRSSIPGGGYQLGSGTSMSCPHVAGAIALLRQYNPEASIDTIKWALMQSAVDLGIEGEDNAYGHGLINVRAALNYMPPPDDPFIYVSNHESFDPLDGFPEPGDDVELVVTLFNTGIEAYNVFATIISEDPYIDIANDSSYWGDIGPNESPDNEFDPYLFSIYDSCPTGHEITLTVEIYADGYSRTDEISILVHAPADHEIADYELGNREFTISNFGRYGLYPSDLNHQWHGKGFVTPRQTINYLLEGAVLIGDGPTRVSNAARDENRIIFSDFAPLATISSDQPGSFADLEYSSSFDDRNAVEPLGITVNQTSYGWANLPDDSYIITVYEITNDSDVDLNGLRIAHYEDWDMPWIGLGNDKVNFDRQRNLGYQHYINFYRGMMVLNNEGACSFKALRNESEVDPPYFSLYDKWSYMNAGFSDTAITEPENASMMLTTGPFDIPSGSTVIAAFAILGANHLDNLQELADAAQSKYDMMTDINERPVAGLPIAFGIQDCYPNPFNPSAAIKFALDKSGQVELVIYDALGRRVKSLVDEPKETGLYKVSWDGRNYAGNRVASGVYFARLRCDEQKAVEKIVLLR